MHKLIEVRQGNSHSCWNDGNLDVCFEDALRSWKSGIYSGIPDVFFPDLNLMKRISKHGQALDDAVEFLRKVLRSNVWPYYDWKEVIIRVVQKTQIFGMN